MKLKADSKHKLNDPTGIHRMSVEDKLLSRAQRGKLSTTEAASLVTGGNLSVDKLTQAVKRKGKRELK